MKLRGVTLLALIAVVIIAGAAFLPKCNSQEKEAALMSTILGGLQRMHFQPVAIDDNFSKKLFSLYLERIDDDKRFFTQPDIDQLKQFELQLDDQANSGTYEFFNLATELNDQALSKIQKYYRETLEKPFDFDKNETIERDGKKRQWSKNDDELRNYWRQLMKYETLTRLSDKIENQKKDTDEKLKGRSTAELEEMSRKEVLKVYDDYFDRLKKLKRSDKLSNYLNSVTNIFDPHTNYLEPIDKQNFDINMSGKLEGIGARLQTEGDHTKVSSIVPGGPAWKGKELEENDVILKVGQGDAEPVDITGMQINDVVSQVRGPKGTTVKLTVKKVDGSVKVITIERDVVILEEGFAKSLILNSDKGEKVGYIKLPRFYADFEDASGRFCSDDIAVELEKLKAENVQGIILDLRNNGGGSLRDVVRMSGFFIEQGPIVQVKSRSKSPEIMEDLDPKVQYAGPLIVMVNEFSASASEILAAALQDYGRAIIVGSPATFGKGTVQRFYDLDRSVMGSEQVKPLGQIKLTTQKFYRINGGSTQLKGVRPDIVLPDAYQYIEVGEKENDYPMAWSEIPQVPYNQNVLRIKHMSDISGLSANRVKGNEVFQKVEANAKRLKKQRDHSQYPLSLTEFTALSEEMEAEAKAFDDLFKDINQLTAQNLSADMQEVQSEESKKARNEDWLKSVKKDLYIYETLNIMHDFIKNEVVDSRGN
jgi:carboxyl-terminal processing protease